MFGSIEICSLPTFSMSAMLHTQLKGSVNLIMAFLLFALLLPCILLMELVFCAADSELLN